MSEKQPNPLNQEITSVLKAASNDATRVGIIVSQAIRGTIDTRTFDAPDISDHFDSLDESVRAKTLADYEQAPKIERLCMLLLLPSVRRARRNREVTVDFSSPERQLVTQPLAD